VITYLSGVMAHADNDKEDWRKEITKWLNESLEHNVIDSVIELKKLITDNNAKDFLNWKKSDPDRFIEFIRLAIKKDLDGIVKKADYIICLWNKIILKGGGTNCGVTLAYYNRKPIYLVNQLPIIDLSGWIMSCTTDIVNDFEALKKLLYNKYHNANNRS